MTEYAKLLSHEEAKALNLLASYSQEERSILGRQRTDIAFNWRRVDHEREHAMFNRAHTQFRYREENDE